MSDKITQSRIGKESSQNLEIVAFLSTFDLDVGLFSIPQVQSEASIRLGSIAFHLLFARTTIEFKLLIYLFRSSNHEQVGTYQSRVGLFVP